ncbi:MAG TPA: CNNM domain-containing protein [Sumerlaeia bacterium]|nr:CNNM domain-containing protein [Sumerlaeia bacterium]
MEAFLETDSDPPSSAGPTSSGWSAPRKCLFLAAVLAGTAAGRACVAATGTPVAVERWEIALPSWEWIGFGLCLGLAGSSLFAILGYALFALDVKEIGALARSRPRSARVLVELRKNLDLTWFALLAGSVLFNLVFAMAVGGAVLVGLDGAPGGLAFVVSLVAAIVSVLAFGEIVPGLLAAKWLATLAPFAAQVTRVWSNAMLPLSVGPVYLLRLCGRFSRLSAQERHRMLEVERRLLTWIGLGEIDVSLEEEEREMIDHAFGFGQRTAGDIMRPRSEAVGFDADLPQSDALAFMRDTPCSRVLVYRKSLDDIVGVLHTKQILLNTETDYRQMLAPPLFVPDDVDLVELMALMKRERCQLVVVLDRYGATAGIVSMDDLLQELVGPLPTEEEAAPEGGVRS